MVIHPIHHALRLASIVALSCGVLIGPQAQAQIPGGQTGFNPALLQLFGNHKAFSSKVDLRMTDTSGKEVLRTPMLLSVLDRRVRVDVNINQISSSNLDPEGLNMFKRANMDLVVSILRPDDTKTLVMLVDKAHPADIHSREVPGG